jgi:hypothetical protein
VTPDVTDQIAALKADVRVLEAQSGVVPSTTCYLKVSEDEARELASGYVPQTVIAMCRLMLAENDGTRDQQRAARPVKKR